MSRVHVFGYHANCSMLTWCVTRKEARRACEKANAIAGYTPSCVVVRYEAAHTKGPAR